MSIKIVGLERCMGALDRVANNTELSTSMEKACLLVEREAKTKCPVGDSGTLRQSIASSVESSDNSVIGYVYTNIQYAPYVEYGTGLFAAKGNGRTDVPWCYQDAKGEWHLTSGQMPQPFMVPALNENRNKIKQILEGGLHND